MLPESLQQHGRMVQPLHPHVLLRRMRAYTEPREQAGCAAAVRPRFMHTWTTKYKNMKRIVDFDKIKKLISAGYSIKDACKEVGFSRQYVYITATKEQRLSLRENKIGNSLLEKVEVLKSRREKVAKRLEKLDLHILRLNEEITRKNIKP